MGNYKYGKNDKGAKSKNERYMKGMKGGGEVMKHDGSVHGIETTGAQKFDMGKVQMRPMERKGYSVQAFDYKC